MYILEHFSFFCIGRFYGFGRSCWPSRSNGESLGDSTTAITMGISHTGDTPVDATRVQSTTPRHTREYQGEKLSTEWKSSTLK